VSPHWNTLEDALQNFLQVNNQILETNIVDDTVQTNTLEDTLKAFMQSQTQINQELKNSLDRIESHLKNEI
jgi:hypothetical protein